MTREERMARLNWANTSDGFALAGTSLADYLLALGIRHTGLSDRNSEDVTAYYDDWYPCRVGEETYGLVKLREQEHDYVPGFADGDDPGVTVSFVPFDMDTLLALQENQRPEDGQMQQFVEAFRKTTEYRGQDFSPVLQGYFSSERSEGSYLIADCYLQKLAFLITDGTLPFPEGMADPPARVTAGLKQLNDRAGRSVCDFEDRCIRVSDPEHLTEEEACALLAVHTGNLDVYSFAAEVKFHADALISWQNKIPYAGRKKWYASALRADMQLEKDGPVRKLLFDSYHRQNSRIVLQQKTIHKKL